MHYYVPSIPMTKPQLMAAVHERDIRSVSGVFRAFASDGKEDAASKPALASLLITVWNDAYEDEGGALFINDRVHGSIQDGRHVSPWCPRCRGASAHRPN